MDRNHILKYYLQKGGLNYWDWLYLDLQQEIKNMKIKLEIEEEDKFNEKLVSEVYFKTRYFCVPNNFSITKNNTYKPILISSKCDYSLLFNFNPIIISCQSADNLVRGYTSDTLPHNNFGRIIVNYYQERNL